MIRPLRALTTALAATCAFAAAASTASGGVLVASAPDCDTQSLSRPFLPWADPMQYVLAPRGDFESAGWRTTGAARVVDGNESFYVGGATDHRSLALGDGASAASGAMCVGLEHPTIRFFARQTGGRAITGHLDVDVLFEDAGGALLSAPVASVGAGSAWSPTAAYPMVANLLPLLPGEHTPVAFRVSADGGDFQIDDFYVDPYNRG